MEKMLKRSLILFLYMALGCNTNSDPVVEGSDDSPIDMTDDGVTQPRLVVAKAFPQLSFIRPVDLQAPADGTNRIFIVEQRGVIRTFSNTADASDTGTFLDIENDIFDGASEMGLLGLAFHPDYETNGFFYVNYNPTRSSSRVSRFQVSEADPNRADPNSELVILEFSQPFTNHNGGQLAFGPDGFLYISSGDGGAGGDPEGNAQNLSTLLGTILRIDVNNMAAGNNYAIPADNPFVNETEARDEIYAYGLRNPWRMSFDSSTGILWAADVGQGDWEEIDIIENGKNYGWDIREGNGCFEANGCSNAGLTAPRFEYDHGNNDLSITGGYVYRGSLIPTLSGRYIYGDYVSGRIWALNAELNGSPVNELLMDTSLEISSFGTDENSELYICAFDGSIYKFEEN